VKPFLVFATFLEELGLPTGLRWIAALKGLATIDISGRASQYPLKCCAGYITYVKLTASTIMIVLAEALHI